MSHMQFKSINIFICSWDPSNHDTYLKMIQVQARPEHELHMYHQSFIITTIFTFFSYFLQTVKHQLYESKYNCSTDLMLVVRLHNWHLHLFLSVPWWYALTATDSTELARCCMCDTKLVHVLPATQQFFLGTGVLVEHVQQ